MLHDIIERFLARSPTTQPSVRRATTGATALTCSTHGALSSRSWRGPLLIRTSLSPQPDPGDGTTPTWYAPLSDLASTHETHAPSCPSLLPAYSYIFLFFLSSAALSQRWRHSEELNCCSKKTFLIEKSDSAVDTFTL